MTELLDLFGGSTLTERRVPGKRKSSFTIQPAGFVRASPFLECVPADTGLTLGYNIIKPTQSDIRKNAIVPGRALLVGNVTKGTPSFGLNRGPPKDAIFCLMREDSISNSFTARLPREEAHYALFSKEIS